MSLSDLLSETSSPGQTQHVTHTNFLSNSNSGQTEQYLYELSSEQEEEIRESFLIDKLKEFSMVSEQSPKTKQLLPASQPGVHCSNILVSFFLCVDYSRR